MVKSATGRLSGDVLRINLVPMIVFIRKKRNARVVIVINNSCLGSINASVVVERKKTGNSVNNNPINPRLINDKYVLMVRVFLSINPISQLYQGTLSSVNRIKLGQFNSSELVYYPPVKGNILRNAGRNLHCE